MLVTPGHGAGDDGVDLTCPMYWERFLAGSWKSWHDPRAPAEHPGTERLPTDSPLDDNVLVRFPAYGDSRLDMPRLKDRSHAESYFWMVDLVSL